MTDKIFIEMCEKAEKMQEEWHPRLYDFVYDVKDNRNIWRNRAVRVITNTFASGKFQVGQYQDLCTKADYIFLPNQSQLQEMISAQDLANYKVNSMKVCLDNLLVAFEQFYRNQKWFGKAIVKFPSMEQLWLEFVMKIKYGKKWQNGKWIEKETTCK